MSKDPKTEWEEDAEFSILDGNPYYIDGPTYKIKHDIADIVLFGEMPEMHTDTDKFTCALEVGRFIRRNGFSGNEENIAKLFGLLNDPQRIICIKEWSLQQVARAYNHEALGKILSELIKRNDYFGATS